MDPIRHLTDRQREATTDADRVEAGQLQSSDEERWIEVQEF